MPLRVASIRLVHGIADDGILVAARFPGPLEDVMHRLLPRGGGIIEQRCKAYPIGQFQRRQVAWFGERGEDDLRAMLKWRE